MPRWGIRETNRAVALVRWEGERGSCGDTADRSPRDSRPPAVVILQSKERACTDLCARGMDFKAVNVVIDYDLPTGGVTYVHRIGKFTISF